MLTVAGRNS